MLHYQDAVVSNLYLINFEPSVISAKKEAILEYNRLRSTVNLEIVGKWNVLPRSFLCTPLFAPVQSAKKFYACVQSSKKYLCTNFQHM